MNFVPSDTSLVPFKGYKFSVLNFRKSLFEGAAFSPSGGAAESNVSPLAPESKYRVFQKRRPSDLC